MSGALRRRALLAGGAGLAVAAWWGWPLVAPLVSGGFDFEPIDDPPGFRRIAGGAASGGPDPFAGLDAPRDARAAADDTRAAVRADLCRALFGARPGPGAVPIASFSDYQCPYCRVLTRILSGIESGADGRVRVRWHEWPLLGGPSRIAARAALAADLQGAYPAFHERLMRSRFVPTPGYLDDLARRIGIDPARMREDMESAAVSRRLAESAALADLFGFAGTPALAVGRTVVVGAMSEARLRALIERERSDGALPACR